MANLIMGIILFFGVHSISIFARPLRDSLAQRSALGWKLVYTLISIGGIMLIVNGYADLRQDPVILYTSPTWLRHLSSLLILPVFILFIASYVPSNIKSRIKHPQLIAVKLWALGHLMVNGSVSDLILFGSFLVWAIAQIISMKRRQPAPSDVVVHSKVNDAIVIVVGLVAFVAFAKYAHYPLIGVAPF